MEALFTGDSSVLKWQTGNSGTDQHALNISAELQTGQGHTVCELRFTLCLTLTRPVGLLSVFLIQSQDEESTWGFVLVCFLKKCKWCYHFPIIHTIFCSSICFLFSLHRHAVFSFGQSSIFLLGGLKREEAPTAMFMHSGDIMVMSGFSRLLHHAVPRVLPNPEGTALPSCLDQALPSDLPAGSVIEQSSEEDWQVCAKYLQSSRINMTIRQVLAEGQNFPEESGTEIKGQAPSEDGYHQENGRAKRHKANTDS